MTIELLDYAGKRYPVEIPDDTDHISGVILSGDMVMNYPVHFDTGRGTRRMDLYDGDFFIPKEEFENMKNIKSSYGF